MTKRKLKIFSFFQEVVFWIWDLKKMDLKLCL